MKWLRPSIAGLGSKLRTMIIGQMQLCLLEKRQNLMLVTFCSVHLNLRQKVFSIFGFPQCKLLRHQYGFDENEYFPAATLREPGKRFTALFVGVDPVRKGLHLALEAWLSSPASKDGTFLIAGQLSAEFMQRYSAVLSHPSIIQLGHRHDVRQLMQGADVLLIPSIEEGFGLVCAEAIGVGCVPLASKACTEMCRHMENALVHNVGDVSTLRQQISDVYDNPEVLAMLRAGALQSRTDWTWAEAGRVLMGAYQEAICNYDYSDLSQSIKSRLASSIS